ncbi:hypothetical protein SAMN05444483_101312 [Salegentibacter echinorum]|uniref:CarboxypepD_reg-like domain-containing protein n=1 Tax=Salegentibacter echinorum TaxID=1073325 RepID=A0A1M5C2R1_SALEC|nr:carboxypeptidase-like regulatory domain-containing protein [Salegentibacter echinorum]SHF49063.1 hypothetical protein SAMN05444483_101312 [Salegentibacter echinorum]
MRKSFTVVFLLLSIPYLHGQERVAIKGEIITDSIVAPIHIINITAEKGSLSNASGKFELEAAVGDTLVFSSVQFQKKEIAITAAHLTGKLLEITLHPELNELDEVRLHQLSGNLAKDIISIVTYDPRIIDFALSDKKPLIVEERKLFALSDPNDPVGQIYGAISGEKKRLRKAIKSHELRTLVLETKKLFPQEFFTETLKIEAARIIDFVYFCSRKKLFKQLVDNKENLELMRFFKEMASEYDAFLKNKVKNSIH